MQAVLATAFDGEMQQALVPVTLLAKRSCLHPWNAAMVSVLHSYSCLPEPGRVLRHLRLA